jgi:hypothetical protein
MPLSSSKSVEKFVSRLQTVRSQRQELAEEQQRAAGSGNLWQNRITVPQEPRLGVKPGVNGAGGQLQKRRDDRTRSRSNLRSTVNNGLTKSQDKTTSVPTATSEGEPTATTLASQRNLSQLLDQMTHHPNTANN